MSVSTRRLAAAAIATTTLGIGLLGVGTASAHVYTETEEVPAGGSQTIDLVVPHGCEAEATNKVEVQLPASVISASPVVQPGWTAEVTKETLDTPVTDAHGNEVTERTAQISWTARDGFELPDGQIQLFGVRFTAPDEVGETLFFKTIQTCDNGESAWIEEWDGTGDEPDKPAPSVKVAAAEEGGHGGGSDDTTATTAAGDSGPATDAGSTGDDDGDDGSSNGLAIGALVVGLAGLGVGGTALAKSKKA